MRYMYSSQHRVLCTRVLIKSCTTMQNDKLNFFIATELCAFDVAREVVDGGRWP